MTSRHKRSSPVSSPPSQQVPMSNNDLKHKVIASLNKLSDRDTRALAIGELEVVAKSLSQDNFSTFLSCLYQTDSSSKPIVRRQVVILISTLSSSHGTLLVPYLSKIISTLTRRLADSDSAVRAACVSAASSLSSRSATDVSSSSLLFGSLLQVLSAEQDFHSQIGAAMCLEAVVLAAPEMDTELLRMALPKLRKLVKTEGFKPKGAVLGLIGSVVGAGGASAKSVLDWVVPCLIGFLSSEDWVSRKAAAEALGRVALKETEFAKAYRHDCLMSLENRRFDKVKVVRETMNQTLALWKGVPEETSDVCEDSTVRTDDSESAASSPMAKLSFNEVGFKTPLNNASGSSSSSAASCVTTYVRQNPIVCYDQKEKCCNGKVESAGLYAEVTKKAYKFTSPPGDFNSESEISVPKPKSSFFSTIRSSKKSIHGFRSGSKVVPFLDDESLCHREAECSHLAEETFEDAKDIEDLSLIRKQLNQIENQQSNLLHFLQRSIGKSQSGINSLESRLNGLEMALDEISYDMALSNGNFHPLDLSTSKMWRRPQVRHSAPKLSSINQTIPSMEADMFTGQRINRRASCGPLTDVTHEGRRRRDLLSHHLPYSINEDLHIPNATKLWKPNLLHV